jgi:DNA-binding MarR family transcriptional regulator
LHYGLGCCKIKLLHSQGTVKGVAVEFKRDLEKQVMMAARDNGISSVLFRNAIGRRLSLNVTDSACLSLLSIKGISTPSELARYTGLTTGAATAMLDRLEKAGFIRRKPNTKDRRGVLIEINERYTEAAGPLVAGIQKAQTELIASYSDRELETIVDFLTRFTKNVNEHTRMIEQDWPRTGGRTAKGN